MISILGDTHNLTGQVPEQLCTEWGIGLGTSRSSLYGLPIHSFTLEK